MMAADARQLGLLWLFFSPAGRLRRKPYAFLWLFWLAVLLAGLMLIMRDQADEDMLVLWGLIFFTCLALSIVSVLTATIKRLRDIGHPPALALCLLVPVAAPFLVAALCVWPGMQQEHAFGRH